MTDIDTMDRPPAPEGWPTCRVCGCWEMAACWDDEAGACWWVEPDLCSHCPSERDGLRPPDLPSAERPAVAPGLRALCFGAAYGLVIGVLVGLAL